MMSLSEAREPFFITWVLESILSALSLPARVRVLLVRSKFCTFPCNWLASAVGLALVSPMVVLLPALLAPVPLLVGSLLAPVPVPELPVPELPPAACTLAANKVTTPAIAAPAIQRIFVIAHPPLRGFRGVCVRGAGDSARSSLSGASTVVTRIAR